jgi:hypothetical protein
VDADTVKPIPKPRVVDRLRDTPVHESRSIAVEDLSHVSQDVFCGGFHVECLRMIASGDVAVVGGPLDA